MGEDEKTAAARDAETMKMRAVSMPNDMWSAVGDRAKLDGVSRAEVVREAVARYLQGDDR